MEHRVVEFIVFGNPVAQGRPRFRVVTKKDGGSFAHVYDPKKSQSWKDTVAALALAWMSNVYGGPVMLDGPLALEATFVLQRPKNHFGTGKKAGNLKDSAPGWHIAKPDLDNLIKGVKDALKGLCYRDDSLICDERIIKKYGNQPRAEIVLRKAGECSIE